MVAELAAGLSSFKTMFDLAKGLKDINDKAVRNAAVIELQEKILTAQAAQAALIERVSDLEEEVARLETWETEKQRYQLKEIAAGRFAYVLKKAMADGQPCHSLCTHCYDRGQKRVLQSNGNPYNDKHALECPACKAKVQVSSSHIPRFSD